ncbi:hypothetical protein GCM10020369_66490 [Cryptosporangium minutisporangium]|uniref:Uncharacterized protein n=1 Tax=Cryptosporangium minutisporangium TaxID=113569 RepID=A0ABP6T8C9_9ACTN
MLSLPALWVAATVFGYPAMLLILAVRGEPDWSRQLEEYPEAWPIAAASPVVAYLLAWWYGPRGHGGLGMRGVAVRAAVLLAAVVAAVVGANVRGLPVTRTVGVAVGVALFTIVLFIGGWRLVDRHSPRSALIRAAVWGGLSVAVAVAAGPQSSGAWAGVALLAGYAALVALGVGALAARALLRPGTRWPGERHEPSDAGYGQIPAPGQIWMAEVRFVDSYESKDRPVVVLRTWPGYAEVLKSTSQDKSGRRDHIPLPVAGWDAAADHDSWLELRRHVVPYPAFRRYRGPCPPQVWHYVTQLNLPAA